MWERAKLKEYAREDFKKNYWISVLAGFVILALSGEISNKFTQKNNFDTEQILNGNIFSAFVLSATALSTIIITLMMVVVMIFVGNSLIVGCRKLYVNNIKGCSKAEDILFVFRSGKYVNVALTMLYTDLVIFLYTLLLIIPGVIKAYEYMMIPYLLAEDPDMSFTEAKEISSRMMDGQKWDAFVLDLSFIGWAILGGIVFPVEWFWTKPYIEQAHAELYYVLSAPKQEETDYNYQQY